MAKVVRGGILAVGLFLLVVALGFYFQWPFATDLWPWQGYYAPNLSSLSYFFLSSIAAAIAAPTIWIGLSGRLRAVAPGALNLTVSYTGIAFFMLQDYAQNPNNTRSLNGAIILIVAVVGTALFFLLSRNAHAQDVRPMPRLVRLSFTVFVVALVLVGLALILKMPNILPWTLSVEASVIYGWIFLGAAAYFTWGILHPHWENAIGQLLGFLAYDIVLIVPFINHLADVLPEHRVSLIVYTTVVTYSGLLAIYYLFINRATRIIGHPAPDLAERVQPA